MRSDPMVPYDDQDDLPCEVCGKDPAGGMNGCDCEPCKRCDTVGIRLVDELCLSCMVTLAIESDYCEEKW